MKTKPLISETEYFRLEFPPEDPEQAKYEKWLKWGKWIAIALWTAAVLLLLLWLAVLVKVIFFKL